MRYCKQCGEPISAEMRRDAIYCNAACRTLASEVRRGKRAEKPQGRPLDAAVIFPWCLVALMTGSLVGLLAF